MRAGVCPRRTQNPGAGKRIPAGTQNFGQRQRPLQFDQCTRGAQILPRARKTDSKNAGKIFLSNMSGLFCPLGRADDGRRTGARVSRHGQIHRRSRTAENRAKRSRGRTDLFLPGSPRQTRQNIYRNRRRRTNLSGQKARAGLRVVRVPASGRHAKRLRACPRAWAHAHHATAVLKRAVH